MAANAARTRPHTPHTCQSTLPINTKHTNTKQAELRYEVSEAWGIPRVKYDPEGWRYWQWRGHKCHYIAAGEANKVR